MKELGQNANDRGSYVINPIPKAKDVIRDMERMAEEVIMKALEGLENLEIQTLHKALNQVIANLSKEGQG